MVEVLLVIIAVGVAVFVWHVVAARRRHAELTDQRQQQLSDLRSEHEKRVGRLRRKFDGVEARGHLDFAADLLPALDALGQALDQSHRVDDVAALREGLQMVDRELVAVLKKHGIEVVCPDAGDSFDPNVHEAVTIEETDAFDDGCVAECFRPGYVHDERVLRAASVAVTRQACAPDQADGDQAGEDQANEDQADDVEPGEVSADAVDNDVEDVEDGEASPEAGSSSRL